MTRLHLLAFVLLCFIHFPAYATTPGEFSLFIFDQGRPVADVEIIVDKDIHLRTDKNGSAYLVLPSGVHVVDLKQRNLHIESLELLTIAGENIQVIVSLKGIGEAPDLDVETSNQGATSLAGQMEELQAEILPKGTLKGHIVSEEDGAAISEVKVFISGISQDVVTDEQGRFEVELPQGNYSMSLIHPDFSSQTRDDVHVVSSESITLELSLTPAGLELSEFIVLAPFIEGSVASVVQETRDSSKVLEVLGASQMAQSGDSNAASALQRVTGLTIEGGKYVVIRGQPSRYTLSLLNGSPLPSPDPIRTVVPLDLFPTDVLAGIEVQKSFSPDKPGSFGGGLVNLTLRGIPEEGFASLSMSAGGNSQSTGKQGLTYSGGSYDYLGADDGTRAVPDKFDSLTQNGEISMNELTAEQQQQIGRSFTNNYQISNKTLPGDAGLSVTAGKSFDSHLGQYGLLASMSWGRKYRLTEELQRDFSLGVGRKVQILNEFQDTRSDMDVNLGGLVVAGGKWKKHELTSNTLFVRDTTKRTAIKEGQDNTSDGRYERNYLLDWNQREMLVQQFVGKHDVKYGVLDWRLLKAAGNRSAPDRRSYTYVRMPDGSFVFYEESGGQRRYNTVADDVTSIGMDFTLASWARKHFTVETKTGFSVYSQDRISDTQRFRFEPGVGLDITSQNPEDILAPDNIGNGLDFADDTQSNDDYRGKASVNGQYLMFDMKLYESWRVTSGFRFESADYEVKTFSKSSQGVKEIVGSFQRSNVLPALTSTWQMNKDMQLRAAYAATVSRPVLVELSETLFFDPDSNDSYLGNPDLKPALINGFDFRWEWYFSTQEMLSIGSFLRAYENPIEKNFVPLAGGSQSTTFENAKSATVLGLELGGRFNLPWVHDGMYLQTNYTLLGSSVNLSDNGVATSKERPLQGQAEYVANLQLGYDGEGHDVSLAFNQVGRRLEKAGVQGLPDVYREAFPSLNFKWSWSVNKSLKLSFTAVNLLDPTIKHTAAGLVERQYTKGIDVKAGVSLKF